MFRDFGDATAANKAFLEAIAMDASHVWTQG
jgi:hypothetical protein